MKNKKLQHLRFLRKGVKTEGGQKSSNSISVIVGLDSKISLKNFWERSKVADITPQIGLGCLAAELGVGPRGPQKGTGPRGPQKGTGPRSPQKGTGPRGPQKGTGPRGPQKGTGPRTPKKLR